MIDRAFSYLERERRPFSDRVGPNSVSFVTGVTDVTAVAGDASQRSIRSPLARTTGRPIAARTASTLATTQTRSLALVTAV